MSTIGGFLCSTTGFVTDGSTDYEYFIETGHWTGTTWQSTPAGVSPLICIRVNDVNVTL
jgi:hypothetical protein